MTDEPRRLYRSTADRKIWGVCGGLADYFNIDPVIVRVVFFILIFASGIAILAYIVLAIVTPSAPASSTQQPNLTPPPASNSVTSQAPDQKNAPAVTARSSTSGAFVAGVILIVIGVVALLDNLLHLSWLGWSVIGPVILIALGLLLFYRRRR